MTYLDEVKALPHIVPISAWDVRREHLRTLLLEYEDWGGFKKWSTVVAALYSGDMDDIAEERKFCEGTIWRTVLQNFGNDNGTAVHQAYSLALYEDVTGQKLTSEHIIVEFGGGYGEMARIAYLVWNPLRYIIYDFPVLGILQRWYLGQFMGTYTTGLKTTFDMDDIPSDPSVMISICGISEAPIEDKVRFLDKCHADSILIRYQPVWEGFDNAKFFKDYAHKWYRNFHHSYPPDANHSYIIAWGRK